MKVTGAYLAGIQKIELRERELKPGQDQVLVKTHLAGICGTDKNFYEGIFPKMKGLDTETRKDLGKPFFFGHEGGGTVVETGERVTRFGVGDKVIAFGWVDTFADYFVAGENDLEPVPEGMDMDLACLGEPIGCALYSGMQSRVQLGDTVAVFGMGFAGQIMAQVVRKKGAYRVVAVDVVEDKLKMAGKLGADVTINSLKEDPVEAILDLTGGSGVDVAVEMAGTQAAVNQCTAAVRHNGTLVFYSWITQDVTLNISRWHNNSLNIVNTGLVHHSMEERRLWTPLALRPVVQDQIKVTPLITHRFRMQQIIEAFEAARTDASAVKVVLESEQG
ncbi:MAG: zinc-binding dehydrogenase [Desulfobacterales bacterium]|jgi:2-desacetyl-2-hydroxyethyl bacteriochlorophyllide A dehydrogenase